MSRARLRVGRLVRYFPTSSEQTSGASGTAIPGIITKVNASGTASVASFQGDGTVLAKTALVQSEIAGGFSFRRT
jgi:hypothetical protein